VLEYIGSIELSPPTNYHNISMGLAANIGKIV
jgi:hypothetical protein